MPQEPETDHDVIVIGGGPAGCSTGVFTARYGFDTIVFDRGNAALRRCAYLENYIGFPAGIDVDAFHDLMHAHVDEAGCDLVPEMVVSVERTHDSSGFVVETQEGRQVTGEYVVAAAWYDGSYLRALGDESMFEQREHHGDVEERFDPDYADEDGRTPIDGLYVASPAGGRSAQAIVAAGNGAHVARSLIEDDRRAAGYTGGVTSHYDWARPESEYAGEWSDRDRWREYFENEVDDTLDEQLVELREQYIDEAFATLRTPEEVESQSERGVRRLVDVLGTDTVLDAIDDETIRRYIAD